MEEKVSIMNKYGERLVGLRAVPDDLMEKNPCMILAHGFAWYKEESGLFDDLAERLSKNGVIVYRFDFSGCGESEGDYAETSLTKLVEDLESIFEYVKKDDKVCEIGLFGQSFGTSAVIAFPHEVKCIVLTGTLANMKKLLAEHFEDGYNPDGVSIRKRSDGSLTKINPGFWKDLDKYDILDLVKKIKCPILFVQGGADDIVPVAEMELVFENSVKGKKVIIEGADHGLLPYREKAYDVIVPWIMENLF